MNERDWVPAHRRLFKGAKKGWPRAIRFVFLELCHEARMTEGALEFPPEWDTLSAVHDRIGGDRKEIRKALTILQIPDSTGAQVIQIERDATEHRLKIVKWESWVGPKSAAERVEDHRKRNVANSNALHPLRHVTPTGEESTEQERRVEAPAPVRSEPRSETRLKSVPPLPPDSAESGFDLARRVWSELWRAKYRRNYEFTVSTGLGSEDRVLQRVGGLSHEHGAGAETYLRHKMAEYLRDKGQRDYLLEHCHPLRTLERDWIKYGEPKVKHPGRLVPRHDPLPDFTPEQAKANQDRASGILAKIGGGRT